VVTKEGMRVELLGFLIVIAGLDPAIHADLTLALSVWGN
jgi:hypothetical protein